MNSVVGSLLAQALVRINLHLRAGYHVPLRRGKGSIGSNVNRFVAPDS
jgi:hypothetical protein